MVKMKEMNSEGTAGNLVRVLKGSVASIVITLVLLLIYSALLTYTSINENTMPIFIIAITAISILAGSLISSLNIKKNGLANGALVGLIYILVIYLLSSIISANFSLNMYSIIMMIASVIAGAIGGIIGVNIK